MLFYSHKRYASALLHASLCHRSVTRVFCQNSIELQVFFSTMASFGFSYTVFSIYSDIFKSKELCPKVLA